MATGGLCPGSLLPSVGTLVRSGASCCQTESIFRSGLRILPRVGWSGAWSVEGGGWSVERGAWSVERSIRFFHAGRRDQSGSPSTLHAPPFTLHPSRSTLHAPRFTLHPSRSTLHAPRDTRHPPPMNQSRIRTRSANMFEGSFTPFDSKRLMNEGRTPVDSN